MSDLCILPLDAGRVDAAFDLATRVFATRSTLHRALDIDLADYRRALRAPFEAMVAEGHSFVAINARDQVIGCVIAGDITLSHPTGEPLDKLEPVTALTQRLTAAYIAHRHPKPGEAVLIDMAAVAEGYGGQGLYRRLRLACQDAARAHGFRRVVGELSSAATQAVVLGQMGHRRVAEVDLSALEFDGWRPFAGILDPNSVVLAEGEL